MHNGQQRRMSRLCRDYQENEANNFMLHACMTTFMLDQLELSPGDISIIELQKLFNVEYEFASKRLNQYINMKKNMAY